MKTRVVLTKEEKRRNLMIERVQKTVNELMRDGYKVGITYNISAMDGNNMHQIYMYDTFAGHVSIQKYLFSIPVANELK